MFLFFSLLPFSSIAEPVRPEILTHKDYATALNYIKEFAEYHRNENNIPGISYALIDGDKIVWQGGLGVSNKNSQEKADESTLYRAGALSTLMTAALIVRMEQEGKLSLDDLVTKYLPEFRLKNQKKAPTIKQLLTHHAGLPLSYFNGMWTESPDSLQQITDKINDLPASYFVDQIFSYSNLGYDLLGRIIEVVSEKSFAEVADEKLFKPLGMEYSNFTWNKVDQKKLALGYKDGDFKPFLEARDLPALGLVSNVNDLAKFAQATMGSMSSSQKVMKQTSWNKMIQAHNSHVKLDLNKGIGLGWQIGGMETKYEKPVVWRQGATLLHRSRIAMIPELGLGVVIMSNSSKGFRALDTISGEALDVLLEIKLGEQAAQEKNQHIELPGKITGFKSLYSSYIGLIKTEKKEDRFLLDAMGWELVLKPEQNGWFRLEYDLLGFIPIKLDWFAKIRVTAANIDGVDVAIINHKSVNYLFGLAMEPPVLSEKWLNRIGVYEPKIKDALLNHYEVHEGELKLYEEVLVFEYELPAFLPLKFRVPLLPLTDNEALIPGLGTGLNERVTVGQDKDGEYLSYSGYKVVEKQQHPFFAF